MSLPPDTSESHQQASFIIPTEYLTDFLGRIAKIYLNSLVGTLEKGESKKYLKAQNYHDINFHDECVGSLWVLQVLFTPTVQRHTVIGLRLTGYSKLGTCTSWFTTSFQKDGFK